MADGKAQQPKIIVPEGVSEFYVNAVNIATSDWDFMLLLGSTTLPVELTAGRHEPTIRIDAIVRMSPQHAKAMARTLQKAVGDYETKHGTLNIPEEKSNANTKSPR